MLPDPSAWVTWACPGCGAQLTGLRSGRRCASCLAAPPRRCDRDTRLALAGVPARYRALQGAWPSPRDPRPAFAGVDPMTWATLALPPVATATLYGQVGTGKTSLAAELLDVALRGGAGRGLFLAATELVERALGGDAIQTQACEVDVLVLDDLGGGHSGRSWEILFRVVKHRHGARLRTIITTMMAPKLLLEGGGDQRAVEAGADALADRLIGEGYMWRLDGASRRVA